MLNLGGVKSFANFSYFGKHGLFRKCPVPSAQCPVPSAMPCNAIQCNTMQYNAMQYNAIQCNTMQYNQYIHIARHILFVTRKHNILFLSMPC